jgi:type IV secretion system protein VirB4
MTPRSEPGEDAMISIRRLLKDYAETGSLSSLLPFWGFVDDHTFLTKGGALGVVYRLRGADVECLDHLERGVVARRFEQALRQLDESFAVYQYAVKQPATSMPVADHPDPVVGEVLRHRAVYLATKANQLFELELFLVVIHEHPGLRRSLPDADMTPGVSLLTRLRERLSFDRTVIRLDDALRRARRTLDHKAQAFVVQLADILAPERLEKGDAFQLLRQLVNYTPCKRDGQRLKYDTHLDLAVADSALECQRDHLRLDDLYVKVLTMKEPPAKTCAAMLHDLYAVPAPFVACLEWRRLSNATMRRDLHARRRHFFNQKVSLVNYVNPQTKPDEMLVDDSAAATVTDLGQSLTAMDVHGHFFGACSLTIALYDGARERVERAAAECAKTFATHDGTLYEESYNGLNAWLAMMPGNGPYNVRRLALLNTNCADLSFLFTLDSGERTSRHLHGRPCLATFETEHQTPYHWNLHVDDVGHALIQGATGAGKSFLLNFILTHAQQYDPTTVVFDLGGSYGHLTRALGGSVWRIGLTQGDFTINPFCLEPTAEHLHFLFSFVRVLLQTHTEPALTLEDDREIYETVENVYTLDPPQRRLLTVAHLLPRRLGQQLHRWVQGGPYANLFDNVTDTLTLQRVQCFDFEGLEKYPLVLQPLLFYVLHRTSAAIQEGPPETLKLFVLDEAWRFVTDATVKAYVTEALKTWRKRNAAMLLATQSTEDFAAPDLLRTVIESCPTKFFLANPNLDIDRARELFHLNHTEAMRITQLRPRQQALLKRPDLARVINLHVDSESYALFTKEKERPSWSAVS